jgi:hypothetical protein
VKIGIGISLHTDPRKAAVGAATQAKQAVNVPTLAIVFGSIHCNQDEVYAGLIDAGIDPSIIFGGSSYAEITPAGVTYKSVAILLLEIPGAAVKTVSIAHQEDPEIMSKDILNSLHSWTLDNNSLNIGLLLSAISSGRENEMLYSLRQKMNQLAIFGGMSCGNYDLGMSHPDFWKNYQYCGSAKEKYVRLSVLRLPRDIYSASFGVGHGWDTLGPSHIVTKSEGATVYEVDGIPIVDFYRKFLGRDADDHFFELLVQRYGLALQMEDNSDLLTKVKTPINIDRKAGCMSFYPFENLQGRSVNLIQANRKSLIAGARKAAELCLAGLEGKKPSLVLAVSCSQRGAILHSRSNAEIEAVREVFGADVPIFGWYSGGEIVPLLNTYDDVVNMENRLGGAGFHGTTIGFLALSSAEKKPSGGAGSR